jgi:beta-lactamase regulating signal transducer with metallopeptidase domain
MNLVIYLLQVTFCLALFYGFFLIALQRQTTFQFNRLYLLFGLVASIAIPFIKIHFDRESSAPILVDSSVYFNNYLDAVIVNDGRLFNEETFSLHEILWRIYEFGIAIFLLRLIIGILRIFRLKHRGIIDRHQAYSVVTSFEIKTPFSFFKTIFLPADHSFSKHDLLDIIRHEESHIRGFHSFDILFMEIIKILLWPSPVIYFYQRKLREIHEFLQRS